AALATARLSPLAYACACARRRTPVPIRARARAAISHRASPVNGSCPSTGVRERVFVTPRALGLGVALATAPCVAGFVGVAVGAAPPDGVLAAAAVAAGVAVQVDTG